MNEYKTKTVDVVIVGVKVLLRSVIATHYKGFHYEIANGNRREMQMMSEMLMHDEITEPLDSQFPWLNDLTREVIEDKDALESAMVELEQRYGTAVTVWGYSG